MPVFPRCGRRCPPSGAARHAAEVASPTESEVVRLTLAGLLRQNRRGRPFRLRHRWMTPWRQSWRRPGCPRSGIPGAWRSRSGQTGGAWWTFRQKTPTRGRGPEPQSGGRGCLPFESNVLACGRQRLAAGSVLSLGLRPLTGTPVVRTAVSTSGPPALLDDAQVQRPRRCDRGKLPGRIQSLPPFAGKVRTRGLPAECQRLRARPQRWVLAWVAEVPEAIAKSVLIQVHVPVLVYARVACGRVQLASTVSIEDASKSPAPHSRGPWRRPGLSHLFIPGSPQAVWSGRIHPSPSRRQSRCSSPRRCGAPRR